jgi:hypothetical protein
MREHASDAHRESELAHCERRFDQDCSGDDQAKYDEIKLAELRLAEAQQRWPR